MLCQIPAECVDAVQEFRLAFLRFSDLHYKMLVELKGTPRSDEGAEGIRLSGYEEKFRKMRMQHAWAMAEYCRCSLLFSPPSEISAKSGTNQPDGDSVDAAPEHDTKTITDPGDETDDLGTDTDPDVDATDPVTNDLDTDTDPDVETTDPDMATDTPDVTNEDPPSGNSDPVPDNADPVDGENTDLPKGGFFMTNESLDG